MGKVYTIFAGVNGAGKSTFYKETNKNYYNNRINSDEILQENNGDWKNPTDQAIAMKEAIRRINYFLDNGISFNQETTLTGNSIINNIKKAKKQGYTVKMYYVGLENVDLAIKRVNDRVKKGGHGIAETDIRRRYNNSLQNLKKVIPLCDRVEIYDNTHNFTRVAVYIKGKPIMSTKCRWLQKLDLKSIQTQLYDCEIDP